MPVLCSEGGSPLPETALVITSTKIPTRAPTIVPAGNPPISVPTIVPADNPGRHQLGAGKTALGMTYSWRGKVACQGNLS